MKIFRWIGVVLVIIVASIIGKIIGHTAGKSSAEAEIARQEHTKVKTAPEPSIAMQTFYALTKARSQRTGHLIVAIVLTNDKNDCDPLLVGRREAASAPETLMTIESEQCVTEISGDELLTFSNKPVVGAYYVSYKNIAWPTRELFYDIDPGRSTEDVCRALVKGYTPIDSKVQCVPPYRSLPSAQPGVPANHPQGGIH